MTGCAIYFLLVFVTNRSWCAKVWLPQIDFMLSTNWQPEEFPDSGQAIVFPSKLNALVGLPSGVMTFSSIVLPQLGGILFPEASFSLCIVPRVPSEIKVSIFKSPNRGAYYSGSNWGNYDENLRQVSAATSSEATPHVERVPCQYETAVFEVHKWMPQPVDFQYHESIEVGNIQIGTSIEGLDNFKSFIATPLGQFLFYNAEDTLIRPGTCINAEKCPCQEKQKMQAICSNVACLKPHCTSPIQPSGHCCRLCGSVFRTNIANVPGSFQLSSFTDKLQRKIASGDVDEAEVDYYVGVDRSNGANVLQFIIVDKGEYGERSTLLMNSLITFFEKQFTAGFQILHAGQPRTPLEEEQVLEFVLLSLMATLSLFGVIYAYYYDDHIFPRFRVAIQSRTFFAMPFVFARFDPHSEYDGVSMDVNFHTPDQPTEEQERTPCVTQPTFFGNPMYEKSVASNIE